MLWFGVVCTVLIINIQIRMNDILNYNVLIFFTMAGSSIASIIRIGVDIFKVI